MNINEIVNSGANVQLVINALDLKEAFLQWSEATKTDTKPMEEERYLSPEEVSGKLGVSIATLWRWDKSGYLKKIKLGSKARYRESDVKKIMEG